MRPVVRSFYDWPTIPTFFGRSHVGRNLVVSLVWLRLNAVRIIILVLRHSMYILQIPSRGRGGGIATYRGMCAHPIIGGSALYLALKLCHKVAHNPNIDLLILTFACTYINKKLCLKMCFLRKLLLCASRTYILASSTINCAENVVMHFQTRV